MINQLVAETTWTWDTSTGDLIVRRLAGLSCLIDDSDGTGTPLGRLLATPGNPYGDFPSNGSGGSNPDDNPVMNVDIQFLDTLDQAGTYTPLVASWETSVTPIGQGEFATISPGTVVFPKDPITLLPRVTTILIVNTFGRLIATPAGAVARKIGAQMKVWFITPG